MPHRSPRGQTRGSTHRTHHRCPPESEAGPQPDKVGSAGLAVPRSPQPEEGVVLDGALPEVLAGPGAVQAEYKRVLLLPALRGEAQGSRVGGRQELGWRIIPGSGGGGSGGGRSGQEQGLPDHHPPPPPVSVCSF